MVAACGGREDGAAASSELIGGAPADDAAYGAVGAIVSAVAAPYRSFCTGTLIAPRAVVTAKHCTKDWPADARFALGADARTPSRTVGIAGFRVAALDRGGFMRLGSDVAVLELSEAVDDVTPVRVGAAVTALDRGKTFVAAGYGARGPGQGRDLRMQGPLKLLAVDGAPLPVRYTTVERFLDAAAEHLDHDLGKFEIEALALVYQRKLLADYESYLVGDAAQTCHGDSGGPLFRPTATGLELVGVISGGPLASSPWNPNSCAGGNIIALFGPSAEAILP
jgi:secreted trypsin-like serine protease